jgi:hypothetical protein
LLNTNIIDEDLQISFKLDEFSNLKLNEIKTNFTKLNFQELKFLSNDSLSSQDEVNRIKQMSLEQKKFVNFNGLKLRKKKVSLYLN